MAASTVPFSEDRVFDFSLQKIHQFIESSDLLSRWVEDAAACLTTVNRIEVLGFPRWHLLDEERRARLDLLVGALAEIAAG